MYSHDRKVVVGVLEMITRSEGPAQACHPLGAQTVESAMARAPLVQHQTNDSNSESPTSG